MSLCGTRQDETGQRYTLHVVDTDGGRKPGILIRQNIYNNLPPFYDIELKLHKWRIFSREKPAEPLTRCADWNHPDLGLRCKVCQFIGAPRLEFITTPNKVPASEARHTPGSDKQSDKQSDEGETS